MVQLSTFIAVTICSLLLFRFVSVIWKPHRAQIRRRLAVDFVGGPHTTLSPLYKNLEITESDVKSSDQELFGTTEFQDKLRPNTSWKAKIEEMMYQAGIICSPRKFLIFTGVCSSTLFLLGLWKTSWIGGVCGLVAGVVIPYVFLLARRKQRRERYLRQLVGAFELMARVLRSGQTVTEGFRATVDAFEEPLSGEFGRSLHQIEHGLRPEVAFKELSNRSGILELRIFVIAMTIQRQSGGNLSETLDRLAALVRARVRLRQKMQAITAEGRLQSWTLTVLPFLTFGVMYVLNRQYAETLLANWKLLVVMFGCMSVGILWIRNIMKFEG